LSGALTTRVHLLVGHALGRAAARSLARRWRQEGETRFLLVFRVDPEKGEDHLGFSRVGLQGVLRVGEADFELDLQLGHFLSPFRDRIEAALRANLQRDLLDWAQAGKPGNDPA
jgi:hypothetical protein